MNEYFIIYDIADPKRLRMVAQVLKDYGQRAQKSKFEASLSVAQLKALQRVMATIIRAPASTGWSRPAAHAGRLPRSATMGFDAPLA